MPEKCTSQADWLKWSNYLNARLANLRGEEVASQDQLSEAAPLRAGFLDTRPVEGGDDWAPYYYVLTEGCLTQYDSEAKKEALNVFVFNVNCTVFETNLRPFSFQLVTAGKVLHAAGNR